MSANDNGGTWETDRKYVLNSLDRLETNVDKLLECNAKNEGFKGRVLGAAAALSFLIALIVSMIAAFIQKA